MFSNIIKHTLVDRNLTISDLARMVGTSRENLSAKIKRDNFCENDMRKIADVLGVKLTIRLD